MKTKLFWIAGILLLIAQIGYIYTNIFDRNEITNLREEAYDLQAKFSHGDESLYRTDYKWQWSQFYKLES
jgi:hypothetical protein